MLKSRQYAVALFLIASLSVLSAALAVDPPPDGGYPDENTAEGEDALFSLVPGTLGGNTAVGFEALYSNGTGYENTGVGDQTLHSNTTGFANTAVGFWALYSNTTGSTNTAVGDFALVDNTGSGNTALGVEVLENNTIGFGNTAMGIGAMTFNTTGDENTAVADRALAFNSTGSFNTAVGYAALNANTTGNDNIAIGKIAGLKLTTGSSNIDIGNQGAAGESRTIRIGARNTHRNTYIAGISGVTVAGGVGVIIDGSGHLGTTTSSAQYKQKIQPMEKASEAILALKPVTFRYKKELDPDGIPQFGLVAEDVAKVNPDLVARDEDGKPYTVRYEAVNAMLLNEFLKEHRKVEEQAAGLKKQDGVIAALQSGMAKQQQEMEALRAVVGEQARRLQRVSERLETSGPAARLVAQER